MRDMASERNIPLLELAKEAESDGGIIDHILDDRQKNIGEVEDNFIIDGRLSFHFIPQGTKIFLEVESHEAARRVFHDETRA
jgi:CMP/dCMP kinase